MNEDEKKPLILIVEDDRDMAQLNARLLKRRGYEAIVAYTVAEALAAFRKQSPDLFVLDIGLPDGDGRFLCGELRRKTDAPILFLSGKSEPGDKIGALNIGGDYYLTKPYDSDEFVAVVRSLIRRVEMTHGKITEASVLTQGTLTLKLDERKAYVKGRDAGLTQKEFAVLLVLVQNENREVTNEQLYESVWGSSMNDDANAVRVQISRLKKKLGEENSKDFAIFAEYGRGYTFVTY